MLNEIILAIVQATTEFLPISSSGHLALVSHMISSPDLFFITMMHVASLLAVLVFTRKEIYGLLSFNKKYKKMWIYLIIATIPAALFGLFFSDFIEQSFSNLRFIGFSFVFTGIVLFSTRFTKEVARFNWLNSLGIGLAQVFALFPGISRSGMTISSGMYFGLKREEVTKFSFLLFIPLVVGAMVLEFGNFYFSFSLIVAFLICFLLSLVFLQFLYIIVKKNLFWLFSIYLFVIGLLVLFFG